MVLVSASFVTLCVCACVRVRVCANVCQMFFFPLFLMLSSKGSQRSYPQSNLCFLPETFGCLELGPVQTISDIDLILSSSHLVLEVTLPLPRQMKIVRSPSEGTGQNGWKEM